MSMEIDKVIQRAIILKWKVIFGQNNKGINR
jgi:hypothetical protein